MANPKVLAPELRLQAIQAAQFSREAGNVLPGTETLAQQEAQKLLQRVLVLETKVKANRGLEDEDILSLLESLNVLAVVMTGPSGLVNGLTAQIQLLEAQINVVEENLPEAPGVPAPQTEAIVSHEIGERPATEFLGRFIHDIRRDPAGFKDFLSQFPELSTVSGDDERSLQQLSQFLEKMETDMVLRVAVEREFYLLFHHLFGVWIDDSFARIGGPTTKRGDSYPMPKDAPPSKPFFLVAGDTEVKASTTFEGVLNRFPTQLKPLSKLLSSQLKAKLAAYGVSERYASSNKSRAEIATYLSFIGGDAQKNNLDGFKWTYNLGDEDLHSLIPPGSAEENREILELQQDFIQGDLIRLALSMIDAVGYDGGKEAGVTEKELNYRLFEQIIEKIQGLYADSLKKPAAELTKTEKSFVKQSVMWAFIYTRNLGADIGFDVNAVDHEVSQLFNGHRYHVDGQKNVSGTGHKEYSAETGRVFARVAVPMEEHVYGMLRIPKDGVEFSDEAGVHDPRKYFRNLQNKYGDKWYLSTEYLNAVGMLPRSMLLPNGTLDYESIRKSFVAVRLKKEYRILGYDDFSDTEGFVFMPKTHVIGYDNPNAQFYGLHMSFKDMIRLRPKYYDQTLAAKEGDADYAGRLVLMSSFPDSATPYSTYLANAAKLYELGVVGKSEVLQDITEVNVTMARYPSDDVLEHIISIPFSQKIDVIRRSVPGIGTARAVFNPKSLHSRKHRVYHHFDVATSSPIDQDVYNAMGLSGLYASTIKYVIDNTISDNARRIIDPVTGEVKAGNPRSLMVLRRMLRDIFESGFEYKTNAYCFPEKLHALIEQYEQGVGNGEHQLIAIRMEILFLMLSLNLSKYKPIPLPNDSKLQDYHKLEVRTYGAKRKAMGPLEIVKYRAIVASFITSRIYTEMKIAPDERQQFITQFGYTENDLVSRIQEMFEYFGIDETFESSVRLLQFELTELEKLPLITDLHKKAPDEKKH